MDFKSELADLLKSKGVENAKELLEVPPDTELGDFSLPCFTLAKSMKKSPDEIAKTLSEEIKAEWIEKIETKGAYLNFFILPTSLVETAHLPPDMEKDGRTVVIEFSSPNIAKPFGIGHLRSTVIGATLARVYEYAGWNVIKLNHIGDWGTQFGKLIAAYKRWPVDLGEQPIKTLLDLYVKFHKEAESDPSLEEEGRAEFKKLERGDKENRKLWALFKEYSLKEFQRLYQDMNVSFDNMDGEAFYEDKMGAVIEMLKEKGLLVESDGAQIVEFDDKQISAPAIILKSDGATMYITRDLAAILYRKQHYNFDRLLYEVGGEQQLHFRQLFSIVKKLGYEWHNNCHHVWHGLYRFQEGKMSTRKGKTIFVEDVFKQSQDKCLKIIEEKNPELNDKENVAKKVGMGAIIFNDLKNDMTRDITFSWREILDFEGESGPYLMYTHARLRSILRKSDETPVSNPELLGTEDDLAVARHLLNWDSTIRQVIQNNSPHTLSHWLLDLAQIINSYYQKHRVIQEDKDLEKARLALIEICANRLKEGLELLGVWAPDEM